MIRNLLNRIDPLRAARAGVIAGLAYLLEQAIDLRVLKVNADDVQLLGRLFHPNPRVWVPLGFAIHFVNALNLAFVYAVAGRYLPGPGWLRGILFAQLENAVLWPIVLLADRYHPGRKDGTLAKYNAPVPFAQAVLRHLAYGAVLGALYPFRKK